LWARLELDPDESRFAAEGKPLALDSGWQHPPEARRAGALRVLR
jgi:hypothetical protein